MDILTTIMGFAYSTAHYLGRLAVSMLTSVLPETVNIASLADPIGYLALLTIFVVIAATVKKLAFIIVLVGWVLILARIGLMMVGL